MDNIIKHVNKLSLKNLINLYLKDNKLNFIAFAVSPWHALGIESLLLENNRLKSGIIIILPHPVDGFIIDQKAFSDLLGNNIKIVKYCEDSKSILSNLIDSLGILLRIIWMINSHRKENRFIEIISPLRPHLNSLSFIRFNFFKKLKINFTLVDEGIGTYAERKYWDFIESRETGKQNFNGQKIFKEALIRLIENRKYISKHFLFKFNDGEKLEINEDIANSYKKLFNNYDSSVKNKSAIIVTQPLSELGIISREKEMRAINKAIEILKNNFYEISIKEHPREEKDKYVSLQSESPNITVISKKEVTIEKLIIESKPNVIVGFNSSALLNANVFFNIPVYTLVDFIIEDINITEYKQQFLYNKKITSNIVKDIKELTRKNKF